MFLLLLLSVSLLPKLTPRLPLSFCDFLQLTLSSSPHSSVCLPPLSPLIPQHAIRFPYTTPLLLIFALLSFVSLCPSYFIFSQFSFYVWHFFFLFDFFKGDCLELWSQKRKGLLEREKERIGHLTKTPDSIQTQYLEIHFWQSRITEQLRHPSVFPFWTQWASQIYMYKKKQKHGG